MARLILLTFLSFMPFFHLYAEPPSYLTDSFRSPDISDKTRITSPDFGWVRKPTSLNGMNSMDGPPIDISSSGWHQISLPSGTKHKQFKISGISITSSKRYYKVLYRIDPRFLKPQVFIWQKDSNGNYVSTLKSFENGILAKANKDGKGATTEELAYMDQYVMSNNVIPIRGGEVVSIKLSERFNRSQVEELNILQKVEGEDLSLFYLSSSNLDNKILYVSADALCKTLGADDPNVVCDKGTYRYNGKNYELYGSLSANISNSNINSCDAKTKGKVTDKACFYDNGRGVGIKIDSQNMKNIFDPMVYELNSQDDYFFYYYSYQDATLGFTDSWQTDYSAKGIFNSPDFSQYMKDWYKTHQDLQKLWASQDIKYNFLFAGNYYFDVEIGQGVSQFVTDTDDVTFLYKTDSVPESSLSGLVTIPDSDNSIYIKINNPKNLGGQIFYSYTYYNGFINFSGPIYSVIKEIITRLKDTKDQISGALRSKSGLMGIAETLLTLYIIIYAIYFLIGAADFTAKELVIRCVKIIFIVEVFSDAGWSFISNSLFEVFYKGIDYLMLHVIGAGASIDNPFGFIDPLINTYTNPKLWLILGIQLLQIFNGGFIISIILLYALIYYLLAILMIISYYTVTVVSISIMLSIAPIFCCMILFEKTKGMFQNYMSTLFSYCIQPTILLIFVLLIDQILADQLLNCLVDCEWKSLFDYHLGLSLRNIGVNLDFSIRIADYIGNIPYIADFPFYVPQYNQDGLNIAFVFCSSLLFACLALIIFEAIPYVDQIVGIIAKVQLPSSQGGFKDRKDAASSIYHDSLKAISFIPNKIVERVSPGKKFDIAEIAKSPGMAVRGLFTLYGKIYNLASSKTEKSRPDIKNFENKIPESSTLKEEKNTKSNEVKGDSDIGQGKNNQIEDTKEVKKKELDKTELKK